MPACRFNSHNNCPNRLSKRNKKLSCTMRVNPNNSSTSWNKDLLNSIHIIKSKKMKIRTLTFTRCRQQRHRSSKSAHTRINTRMRSASQYAVVAISRRSHTNSTHRGPLSIQRTISLSSSSITKPIHRLPLPHQLSNTIITLLR